MRQTIDYQKNYYEILGVSHNATQQEIKNAFYMLSKKVRKNPNNFNQYSRNSDKLK